MSQYRVIFWPEGKAIPVEEGKTLLEAADMGGIHINNFCGGQGVCGECKVRITKGIVEKSTKSISLLNKEEIQQGYVLACQTPLKDNLEVEIPVEARLEGEQILTEGDPLTFSIPEDIERPPQEEAGLSFYSPLTMKMHLKLPLPTLEDNLSDLERIYREIQRKSNISEPEIEIHNIRGVARVLRKNEMRITVTLGRKNSKFKIIQIEAGDTLRKNFGIALDIGTTTVVAQLVDMNSKEILGTKASHNRQGRYGEDVISRIIYACNRNGMDPLNKAVIENIGPDL